MLKSIKYIISIFIIVAIPFIAFIIKSYNNDTNTKVVLIGFDGLEWSIIKELVKEGKMPTFAKLMQNGTYGDLKTYLEYFSLSLWTTIATGRHPEIHGITRQFIHKEGEYELISAGSYDRKVKALWNILSDYKKKVGVISYQCTEPPEAVNGFIIPSIFNVKDIFPVNLTKELNLITKSPNKTETAKVFFNDFEPYYDYQYKLPKHLKYLEICKLSVAIPYLYKKFNKNLDLLMVYYYPTDSISHTFWKFMKPESFQHKAWGLNSENIKKFGNVIKDFYSMVDRFVKKTIEDIADKNTIIIICSDHGFQNASSVPEVSFTNLNKLLEKIGVLYFKYDNAVDLSKTQAYHYQLEKTYGHSNRLISINLKGRESKGIVESGEEYLNLKKYLISVLSDLAIIETNEKLFNKVSESSLPGSDIQILLKNDISLLEQHIKINGEIYPLSDFYIRSDISGAHSDSGVLIIYGKNIKKTKLIEDANILDIAPTILYLLGLPVAKDMEGRVLIQTLNAHFLKINPIRYISTYEVKEVEKQKSYKKYTPKPLEEERLKRLKSLGYVQ